MLSSQASYVIVSGFRAALDLDTYPLSNFRPGCAERAKRGRGKPVLIMHIGFFACFHAISLECSRFSNVQYMHIYVYVYGTYVYVYACTVHASTCMHVQYMRLRVCMF